MSDYVRQQINKLEKEILDSLTKKRNGQKEINVKGHREKIEKLKAQLK